MAPWLPTPGRGAQLWAAGRHSASAGESRCCPALATEKQPRRPEWGCRWPSGRLGRILNLSFVFLLAKFIASWRAGRLFKGGKKKAI